MRRMFICLVSLLALIACAPDRREAPPEVRSEDSRPERAPVPEEEPAVVDADEPLKPDGVAKPAEPIPKGPWPFVGRRVFETRPAVSGTGTPHRVVEILENGDVYFEYGQQQLASGKMLGEKYFAGKFARVMKCDFKELGDARYYVIGRTRITEVEAGGGGLTLPECCGNDRFDQETPCPCSGELFDPGGK